MRLEQVEKSLGGFFAPAFSIKVGGKDVIREHFLTVPGVDVDLKLQAMGRFSFRVANAFDLNAREFVVGEKKDRVNLLDLFAFGTAVSIGIGYGDYSKLPVLMKGIVTEVGSRFSDGSVPELRISGYDRLFKLGKDTKARNWEKSRDSDAVVDMAREKAIRADADRTSPRKLRIDKSAGESDLAFLGKLAKRNKAIYYLRGDTLRFGPRSNDMSEVIELEWGRGLFSFNPEANLAEQVSEVRVHGWSIDQADFVRGAAKAGTETGRESRRRSGGQRLDDAIGTDTVMHVRQPVRNEEEARARAQAALEERAEDFLKGDGESVGLPQLMPDTNVALSGIGRLFSKTYYINEARHKIDAQGYRTTFKCQEVTL